MRCDAAQVEQQQCSMQVGCLAIDHQGRGTAELFVVSERVEPPVSTAAGSVVARIGMAGRDSIGKGNAREKEGGSLAAPLCKAVKTLPNQTRPRLDDVEWTR